ncbi:hypothetical protein LR48_Vigan231s000500 [Vigna angularis]|uniref:Uncharacterized protein n=1 Tax=Phaseolus angularis TaxID=3914 RepID=A0A0L9T680_PHAAN|nr:hypothetical protein LR48_Vigan231s000500 [Vigna angularis]
MRKIIPLCDATVSVRGYDVNDILFTTTELRLLHGFQKGFPSTSRDLECCREEEEF